MNCGNKFPVVLLLAGIVAGVAAQCKRGNTIPFTDSRGVSHQYLISWRNDDLRDKMVGWEAAQGHCKEYCMNLVSIETPSENEFVKRQIAADSIRYIWTGGRRCQSCSIVDGWRWVTGGALGSTNDRANGDWSHTSGGRKKIPQPDNRENNPDEIGFSAFEEQCIAILNNFYNDGIKWHDVACYHKKPFICESN